MASSPWGRGRGTRRRRVRHGAVDVADRVHQRGAVFGGGGLRGHRPPAWRRLPRRGLIRDDRRSFSGPPGVSGKPRSLADAIGRSRGGLVLHRRADTEGTAAPRRRDHAGIVRSWGLRGCRRLEQPSGGGLSRQSARRRALTIARLPVGRDLAVQELGGGQARADKAGAAGHDRDLGRGAVREEERHRFGKAVGSRVE